MATSTVNISSVEQQLQACDDMDFKAFNRQDWNLFAQFHADQVAVTYPDGKRTTGIEPHTAAMKKLFSWAPDIKVESHQVKFGSGEWTAVTGVLAGTFTRPMNSPDGSSVDPTGKPFKLPVCMLAHWQNGKIVEKNLFWDNQALLHQIGPMLESDEESFVVSACD